MKYAHGLISEYLQEDLVIKLGSRFNFTPDLVETLAKKRKPEVNSEQDSIKKFKFEGTDCVFSPPQSNGEAKKQKPLSSKEKLRQKAASGTKTISSFFMKK